jgi:redox-sensitive bicupin YhaK (pirin superfamily)
MYSIGVWFMKSLSITTPLPMAAFSHGPDFEGFGLRDTSIQVSLDPFLSVDHFWMRQPTFAPHPHAGFSAVTYLFDDSQTSFVNRDSLGGQIDIAPGALHWTRAASGLMHEEVPSQPGQAAHGLQIFVNLAASAKNSTPEVHHVEPAHMPVLDWPQAQGRLVFGRYREHASQLVPESNATLLDISLEANATIELAVPAQRNVFLLVVSGSARAGQTLQPLSTALGGAASTTTDAATLTVMGGAQGSRIAVFLGSPLREPVAWGGPFVMNTQAQLIDARQRFTRGAMGRLQPLAAPATRS